LPYPASEPTLKMKKLSSFKLKKDIFTHLFHPFYTYSSDNANKSNACSTNLSSLSKILTTY